MRESCCVRLKLDCGDSLLCPDEKPATPAEAWKPDGPAPPGMIPACPAAVWELPGVWDGAEVTGFRLSWAGVWEVVMSMGS